MDGTHTHFDDTGVTRSIELDARRAAAAMWGLRHEFDGPVQRWTLGAHGAVELDRRYEATPVRDSTESGRQRIVLRGRLTDTDGCSPTAIEIELLSGNTPPTHVILRAVTAAENYLAAEPHRFLGLATAAIDELCEELLYQAIAAPCEGRAAA